MGNMHSQMVKTVLDSYYTFVHTGSHQRFKIWLNFTHMHIHIYIYMYNVRLFSHIITHAEGIVILIKPTN